MPMDLVRASTSTDATVCEAQAQDVTGKVLKPTISDERKSPRASQSVVFEFVDAIEEDVECQGTAPVAALSATSAASDYGEFERRQLVSEALDNEQNGRVAEPPAHERRSRQVNACCWPCARASRVAADTEREEDAIQTTSELYSSQLDQAPARSSKLRNKNTSSKRKKPRSHSLEAELKKIEMHERLLSSDQKRLFIELNQQLNRPDPGEGQHANEQKVKPLEVRLDLSNARAAIECRHLTYHAGLGSFQRKMILNEINLTVPEGSIYGLLGPSGCGKTTMLRCVAGRLQPERGSIRVFGYKPNESGSQIPGPAIGYMPQEISIYEEFTVGETLTFFGRINRMRPSLLRARIEFLLNFLNLPQAKHRLIKTLSGGQKRRVSLAAALVHSPPLLILDEPTVGVDPLLRQIIWKYLVTLATHEKITIVITTHYIEEASQANIVGLMRQGQMLAESSPRELLQRHQQASLENVFLKLCLSGNKLDLAEEPSGPALKSSSTPSLQVTIVERGGLASSLEPASTASDISSCRADELDDTAVSTSDRARSASQLNNCKGSVNGHINQQHSNNNNNNNNNNEDQEQMRLKSMEAGEKYAPKQADWSCWFAVLWALTWKNYLRLKRNPPVLVFEFILPAFQVVLFCLCIGGQPHDIPLAVVNEESSPQASRLFLDSLTRSGDTFRQMPYGDLGGAIQSVELGHTWAVVHIPEGYTKHLKERLLQPTEVTNETLTNGTIRIYPDLTNLHLALTIEGAFRQAFVEFARNSLLLLGYDPNLAELPIRVERPIYGSQAITFVGSSSSGSANSGYLEFMAPGVIISITYVMATGLTALSFVLEKRDGLLERSQVSGVTTSQILLAHALLQVFVMVFQIGLVLLVTFYIFQVPSKGPLVWVVLLVLLQGCAGMSYGLLISAVCNEENTAVMMLVGTFYINLILAGIIWPVEAMPHWLQVFSYAQPQTIPTESLRNILSRGWSISDLSVQLGFVITFGWLVAFLLGAGLCMRYIK